jgi:hypothetical protein
MHTKLTLTLLLFSGLLLAKCDANAQRLVRAYPQIKACKDNYIIWSDGTKMLYDDGKRKNFNQLLNQADIQDMFHYRYIKGKSTYNKPPKRNYDPGRIRNEKFFRKMYGNSSGAVRRDLVKIPWVRGRVLVNRKVARDLKRVVADLKRLPAKYQKYLVPIGGTFKWRKIAGTNRLSVHSFGAAIDINVKYSAYWRWSKGKYRYQNRIPYEIVKAFERHGFIWGGKWYHYDTMHFEYRPELLR